MDASARLVENSSSLLDYVYYYQEVFNDSYSRNGSNSSLPLEDSYDAALVAALSLILGIMILITVIGNVFVIAAILLERNLQNVANYLIVSLAVADLMVACLVMPLGAVYEISGGWILGPELCDMWTSCDVLCCTASILHLVAIAVDRYWAVTNVDYIHSRTQGRIVGMIGVVWSVAVVVSLAPQLGWKDPDYLDRINLQRKCLVSQDISYQVFATCATFYVPLLVILVLYWKIFQTARKRIRRRRNRTIDQSSKSSAKSNSNRKKTDLEADKPSEATMVLVEGQSSGEVEVVDSKNVTNSSNVGGSQTTAFTISSADRGAKSTKRNQQKEGKKESLEAKRERKAAKTLAIITGAFVVCWLPFFIMALLMPLCESCSIADYLASLFLWLGYFNSTLNPVIYTIFSPEFRQAFKRILCGNVNNNRSTIRKFR